MFPRWLQACLTLTCVFLAQSSAHAASWSGKVVWVPDGDTIHVLRQGTRVKIRLYGIDAPERQQAYGAQATALTRKLTDKKTVRIVVKDRDRYGRTVGLVFVGKICVNHALLAAGLAWHYKRYSKSQRMAQLEQTARQQKKGLWANPRSIPPWRWRRKNRHRTRRRRRRKRHKRRWRRSRPWRNHQAPRNDDPKQSAPETPQPSKTRGVFHGNKRSKVLHAPGCRYYMCKNCVVTFATLRQAKRAGYRPHRRCVMQYKRNQNPKVTPIHWQDETRHAQGKESPCSHK